MKKLLVLSMVLMSFVSYGQVIEKQTQTTYVLKMTEQEYNDYLKSKEQKEIIVTKTPKMKPEYNKNSKEGSFGAMGGATTMIGEAGSFINFSGGGWIEYKHIGIEYILSSSVSDDLISNDYVEGKVGKWIAGGSSKSYGVFYKQDNGLYYGGGIQTGLIMGTENVLYSFKTSTYNTTTYTLPKVINEKKTSPYVTIGYMKNL